MTMLSSSRQLLRHGIEGTEYCIIEPAGREDKGNLHFPCGFKAAGADSFAIASEHLIRYLMGGEIEDTCEPVLRNQLFQGHSPASVRVKSHHFVPLLTKEVFGKDSIL